MNNNYKTQRRKKQGDMVIPASALKNAKFLKNGKATMSVTENMIILNKPHMTLKEMEDTAGIYFSLGSSLLDEYYDQTGEYPSLCRSDSNPDDLNDGMDECGECECAYANGCDSALSIPPCILEEAGISPFSRLSILIYDGSILITTDDDNEGDNFYE